MSSIISDICENIITGRELTQQGDNETALHHLRKAVQQSDGLIKTINDTDRKKMWRDIKALIAQECELVLDIERKQRHSNTECSQGLQGSEDCQSKLGGLLSLISDEALVSLYNDLDNVHNLSSPPNLGNMRAPLARVYSKSGQHSMVGPVSPGGKFLRSSREDESGQHSMLRPISLGGKILSSRASKKGAESGPHSIVGPISLGDKILRSSRGDESGQHSMLRPISLGGKILRSSRASKKGAESSPHSMVGPISLGGKILRSSRGDESGPHSMVGMDSIVGKIVRSSLGSKGGEVSQHSIVDLDSLGGKIVQRGRGIKRGKGGQSGQDFQPKKIGEKSDAKKKKVNERKTSNEANEQNRKQKKSGNTSETQSKRNFEGSADSKPLVDVLEALRQKELGVKWEDIANLEKAKVVFQEAFHLPLLWPGYFTGIRKPGKGVLMFGPPGTGKTLLAKAVASLKINKGEETTFFNVTCATLTSQWFGESEKLVQMLFQMARHYAPSVIFIDEIDALMGRRGGPNEDEASRRQKNEFLTEMDGLTTDSGLTTQVTVLAATNFPWHLDEGLRRRFEKRIYIPLPTQVGREALLDINLRGIERSPNLNFKAIAQQLEGYSGSDIHNVCRDACMMGMRRMMAGKSLDELACVPQEDLIKQPVTQEHFDEAIRNIKSSVSAENLKQYEEWDKKFGSK